MWTGKSSKLFDFFYCDIHFISTIKEPNLQDKNVVDSQKIKSNESKDTR